jgi:enamine deaminase RidA (YjgF/YER057c/UK114 family)
VADKNEAGLLSVVEVPSWPRPKGYVNGMLTAGNGERILFVAGQVGWEADETFKSDDFVYQFGKALDNVLAVVRAAGGEPSSVARMTVFVTDLQAYRTSQRELSQAWRARFGRHYPAMALICISSLLEVGGKVEIEATCVLPATAGAST